MGRQKRGQITVFVILGILLLLMIITFLLLKRNPNNFNEDTLIPPDVAAVKKYVETCAEQIAIDGLKVMGQQGGYISIPPVIANDPAGSLRISPNLAVRMPYWYYQGKTRVPSLGAMETDLSRYITSNLDVCLDNLTSFSYQFQIIEQDSPKVSTTLGNNVIVKLEYPIIVKNLKNTEETRIKTFTSTIDLDFSRIYELAARVLYYENQRNFFENLTIDLMSLDPKIPFTNIELHCGALEWEIKDVKDELLYLLPQMIPLVRVANTNHREFQASEEVYVSYKKYAEDIKTAYENVEVDDLVDYGKALDRAREKIPPPKNSLPSDAYEHQHFLMDINSDKFSDLRVGFNFDPRFDLALAARPSRDGKLSSKYANGNNKYLSFLCLNTYHFTYDVVYPVVTTIIDENALYTEGYSFSFAFPVIIRNNEGARATKSVLFDSKVVDLGFCNQTNDYPTDIRVYGTDDDGYLSSELKGVNISYQCYTYACELGKTKQEESIYRLLTALPANCDNPYIIASKEGYKTSKVQISGDQQFVDINIPKILPLQLKVLKHKYFAIDQSMKPSVSLDADDNVTIYIYSHELEESQSLMYPLDNTILLAESGDTIDISALLISGQEQKKNLDITGGFIGNNTFSSEDLLNKHALVLHVFEYLPAPVFPEDEQKMMTYFIDGDYKELLKPEFE